MPIIVSFYLSSSNHPNQISISDEKKRTTTNLGTWHTVSLSFSDSLHSSPSNTTIVSSGASFVYKI
jgi:hypothetical protein